MNETQFNPDTGEIIEPPAAVPVQSPKRRRAAKKKGRAAIIPVDETPRQRFLRRSTTQMTNALTAIDLIASFGRHRGNYEYADADAARLADRLDGAVERLRRELARPPSRKDERDMERSFGWDEHA